MDFIRIESPKSVYFNECWEIYDYSFPRCEKRNFEDQIKAVQNPAYHFTAVLEDEAVVGVIGFWIFEREDFLFMYVEHFAIAREQRGRGIGAACVEYLKEYGEPMILEVELPVDDITTRRLNFYEREGFVFNDHKHQQPPYNSDEGYLPLGIMTYPEAFSAERYEIFRIEQMNEMPKFE